MINNLWKNKVFWVLLVASGVLLVVALVLIHYNTVFTTGTLQAQPSLPSKPSEASQEMATFNTKRIEKLSAFLSDGNDPILQVSPSPDRCCVFAIYKSGKLIKWDVGNDALVSTYELGPAESYGTNFSADGSRLILPRQILNFRRMLGANVWDTSSGKLIFCEGLLDECPDGQEWNEKRGFLLDPSGEWLFGYHLRDPQNVSYQISNIDIQSVTRHSVDFTNSTYLLLGDEYFHDKYAQVELMTTDRNTRYLAYALANGLVRVETAGDPISLADYGSSIDLTEGLQKKRVEVIDLKIDDTDTWLAELRSDALLVWNLQQGSRPALAFRVPVSTGTGLAFDHAGQILALATNTEIRFYDLNKGMAVASIPAEGTSAISFTRDNRMLISGDATGNLYIWGDPKQ